MNCPSLTYALRSEARLQRSFANRKAQEARDMCNENQPFLAADLMNEAARYAHAAEVLNRLLSGV